MIIVDTCTCGCKSLIQFIGDKRFVCQSCGLTYWKRYNSNTSDVYFELIEEKNDRR